MSMLTHVCKRSGKCSFSSTPNSSLIAFPIKLWAHEVSAGALRRCCVCRSGLLHGPPGSGRSSSWTAGQASYLSGHLLHVLRGSLPILVQTLGSPVFAAGRRASRWRMRRRPLGQGGWKECSLLVFVSCRFLIHAFCVSYRSESEQVEDAEATAAAQKKADEEAKEKVCPSSTANCKGTIERLQRLPSAAF